MAKTSGGIRSQRSSINFERVYGQNYVVSRANLGNGDWMDIQTEFMNSGRYRILVNGFQEGGFYQSYDDARKDAPNLLKKRNDRLANTVRVTPLTGNVIRREDDGSTYRREPRERYSFKGKSITVTRDSVFSKITGVTFTEYVARNSNGVALFSMSDEFKLDNRVKEYLKRGY